MTAPYFLGIDVGTQGVRVVLLDARGNAVGSCEKDFPLSDQSREEQSPVAWWQACRTCLKSLLAGAAAPISLDHIKAMAVTSTSGTVIPLDARHQALHPALMYSDKRQAAEGEACREAALRHHPQGYTGFNASSGLSKMVWFARQFPEKARQIAHWVHAADYITGQLSGRWGITDYTNALKSGYAVEEGCWPAYIYQQLPIRKEWLPEVVPPGTPIGTLQPALAAELGLPASLQVVAGMTDGCASQIASGAVNPGDWNTTIGTTLVVKGVTRQQIRDPAGRLYNHRHPEGFWMPGGASNTGADWVAAEFPEDLAALDAQAGQVIPSGRLAYPLRQEGERFPFIAPQARGFEPPGLSRLECFVANMEGVAYVERYAFEMIRQLSGEKVKAVFTAGGASNSDTWLTIRSNVLNLPIYKMRHVTGAVGAAILAASKTHFPSVIEAAKALTQIEKEVHPSPALREKYQILYRQFLLTLQEKGYIHDHQYI